MRILCVCLGNICRSPMAEGALRTMGQEAGLGLTLDSAGTSNWHIGDPPDPRGLAAAAARGYDNAGQRARQVGAADFHDFDLILAMDRRNLRDLERLRPEGAVASLRLFDPEGRDIPDPYDGTAKDYEYALDMVEHASQVLIAELVARR